MAIEFGARFTPKKRAILIAEIRTGLITRAAAIERHHLSEEELAGWERDFDAHGRAGLSVTKIQQHRRPR